MRKIRVKTRQALSVALVSNSFQYYHTICILTDTTHGFNVQGPLFGVFCNSAAAILNLKAPKGLLLKGYTITINISKHIYLKSGIKHDKSCLPNISKLTIYDSYKSMSHLYIIRKNVESTRITRQGIKTYNFIIITIISAFIRPQFGIFACKSRNTMLEHVTAPNRVDGYVNIYESSVFRVNIAQKYCN